MRGVTPRSLPFVLAASDHGPMIVSRLDYNQTPSGFYGVGFQILHNGSYERGEVRFVLDLLHSLLGYREDGIVALDCGANIGVLTVEMAREMRDWGSVYAFEPQERIFYALCGNIALGNFFNAQAILGAVGETAGTIRVPVPDYGRAGSFGSLELRHSTQTEFIGQPIDYGESACRTVQLFKIDDLNLPRVDFIKLDIEGMEIEALRGAQKVLERDHPTLFIEWIKCGQTKIREFLSPFGYTAVYEFGMNLVAEWENY